MTVRIDNAGRIVVPKAIRDRLGFRPDTEINLVEQGGGAFLTAVSDQPSLVMINGVLVHQGRAAKTADWTSLIEDVREERIRSTLS